MSPTKQLNYLATIKKNHKIHTHVDEREDDYGIDTIWRHLVALKHGKRLFGVPLIQDYSVAIHCYYTGLLFEEIAKLENISISQGEINFVYRHDIFETVTGDVLLPVKIHSESVKKKWEEIEKEMLKSKYKYLQRYTDEDAEKWFTPVSYNLFKACDLFELYLFCRQESDLGNMSDGVWSVIMNCQKLLPEFNISTITEYIKSPL